MNYEIIKNELLKAVRGKKTQGFINQKLKRGFNQAYRWEAGYSEISWLQFVELCQICRVDLDRAIRSTFAFPHSCRRFDLLIQFLIGKTDSVSLAKTLSVSSFRVRRWLGGKVAPDLRDMLILFDRVARQLPEFVGSLVPIELVPSLKLPHLQKSLQKKLHTEIPFAGALLHLLELESYKALKKYPEGWIASKLGITVTQERSAIKLLKQAGVLAFKNGKYHCRPLMVDLRGDLELLKATRSYWIGRSLERVKALTQLPKDELYGYLVFSLSESAQGKVIERYLEFLAEVRFIVENDPLPADRLQLLNVQLFDPSCADSDLNSAPGLVR
jgi:hypothetical protein